MDYEKKGEQKPADKVEPKFKVGDNISKKHNSDINKFGIFTITSITDNKYWYNDSVICDFSDQDLWEFVEFPKFKKGDWVFHNTAEFIYMIQTVGRDGYGVISRDGKKSVVYYSAEINYRLWTIQDAKDGDVLACENGWTCIFKTLVNDETFSSYCFMDSTKWFCETGSKCHTLKEKFVKAYNCKIYPATKEQRDALMKAMADAGYTFDFEKKELKKIEHKSTKWSEEDEKIISRLHDIIFDCKTFGKFSVTVNEYSKLDNWLKSLRSLKQWKPSEEMLEALYRAVPENVMSMSEDEILLDKLYLELKKLKE